MGRKILIVDDSRFTRKMVAAPLSRSGYEVDTIGDPKEALSFLAENPPDLIISDLKMPELSDGVSFLQSLAEFSPGLPVILYSADSRAMELIAHIEIERLAFLSKPTGPEQMLQKVSEMLL